ncbi:MAG: helix-turn-helix transcriptional regulator [Leptospiraceae bacterium]|nr:helix-turn-helix transcriptional regulator [Leptospiraceae bacterium]
MKHSVLKKIGQNIRTCRINKGLSQERLAEICGLHRTYVGSVERGERNISILNLERIANALNTTIKDLLNDHNNSTD